VTAAVQIHMKRWECPHQGCDTSVTASSSNITNATGVIAVVKEGCKRMCGRVSFLPDADTHVERIAPADGIVKTGIPAPLGVETTLTVGGETDA
jgi:hypothetical protein